MYHSVIKHLAPRGTQYGSVIFYTIDRLQELELPTPDDCGIEYGIANSPSSSALQLLCGRYPDRMFEQRMCQKGQQCYVAVVHNQLIAYAWITVLPCYIGEIGMTLPVGAGQFYIYDIQVHPDYRGRGVYRNLLKKILHDYAYHDPKQPFTTVCISVEPDDVSTIRAVEEVGFKRFTQVHCLKVGSTSHLYGDMPLRRMMGAARPD